MEYGGLHPIIVLTIFYTTWTLKLKQWCTKLVWNKYDMYSLFTSRCGRPRKRPVLFKSVDGEREGVWVRIKTRIVILSSQTHRSVMQWIIKFEGCFGFAKTSLFKFSLPFYDLAVKTWSIALQKFSPPPIFLCIFLTLLVWVKIRLQLCLKNVTIEKYLMRNRSMWVQKCLYIQIRLRICSIFWFHLTVRHSNINISIALKFLWENLIHFISQWGKYCAGGKTYGKKKEFTWKFPRDFKDF